MVSAWRSRPSGTRRRAQERHLNTAFVYQFHDPVAAGLPPDAHDGSAARRSRSALGSQFPTHHRTLLARSRSSPRSSRLPTLCATGWGLFEGGVDATWKVAALASSKVGAMGMLWEVLKAVFVDKTLLPRRVRQRLAKRRQGIVESVVAPTQPHPPADLRRGPFDS
jgi:hypothetical protein